MAKRNKKKLPFNEKARLLRRLEEVFLATSDLQSYLEYRKSKPLLEAEMKQLSDKYLGLWKILKKRYHLTDEEMAFAEAEMTIDRVISARDSITCFRSSSLVEKYFPSNFKKALIKLSKQALEIRRQFLV